MKLWFGRFWFLVVFLELGSVSSIQANSESVCEQLRTDPNVGILALGIIPEHKRFLVLTTTYYGYQADIMKLTYPSYAGYPDYIKPAPNESWYVELNSLDLFDVLPSKEREQQGDALPDRKEVSRVNGFILHNQSMANYYVSREVANSVKKQNFVQQLHLVGDSSKRVFSFRRMGKEGPKEMLFYMNQTLPPSYCISAQEPSMTYELVVAKDGKRCYSRADLFNGKIEHLNKKNQDYEIGITNYSTKTLPSCASGVHHCGFMINQLFFALDNKARLFTVYQNPFLSNTTGRIATVAYGDFFRCTTTWPMLVYLGFGLTIFFVISAIGVFTLRMTKRNKVNSSESSGKKKQGSQSKSKSSNGSKSLKKSSKAKATSRKLPALKSSVASKTTGSSKTASGFKTSGSTTKIPLSSSKGSTTATNTTAAIQSRSSTQRRDK